MKLNLELKTTSGAKVKFTGLSKNKGVVWVEWEETNIHILINDLDNDSREKVLKMLEEIEK